MKMEKNAEKLNVNVNMNINIEIEKSYLKIIVFDFRDCPGVGTSSGPVVKEVPFSTGIGGPSAGCKTTPQHNSQTRHPLPNFSQETVESPATAPLLHINICTQVKRRLQFFPYARIFFLSIENFI